MAEKLGQHYLNNPQVAKQIAELLSIEKGEKLMEIGPGKGFLTSYLLDTGADVTGVEIDKSLYSCLKSRVTHPNFKIINEDFLKLDIENCSPDKICGNLPYQIAGKIIEKIVFTKAPWKKAVIMVPEAVACRVTASAGSTDYSALSVVVQASCEARHEFKVCPADFNPPPKIDSAVVSLIRKKAPPDKVFADFVKKVFRGRRKKIKNSLSSSFSVSSDRISQVLINCGIASDARAQSLKVSEIVELRKEFVKQKIF